MINMLFIFIICTQFLVHVNAAHKDSILFWNLPFGDYVIDYKALMPCKRNVDDDIQHNLYLMKNYNNVTELKGNLTFKIHYDDSIKIYIKDSTSGWRDTATVFTATTGCSTFKFFLGVYWNEFAERFHFNTNKCPVPAGVYKTNGYELPVSLKKTNFPSKFYYGTYKFRIFYLNNSKKEVGCINFIIDVKRPSE